MDHLDGKPRAVGDAEGWQLSADETHIARVVAGLIDGELERRRPATPWHWLAPYLDVDPVRLCEQTHMLRGIDFVAAAVAIGEQIDDHAVAVTGPVGEGAPTWGALRGPQSVRYPVALLAAVAAGELAPFPLGLQVRPMAHGHQIAVIAAEEHQQASARLVSELVDGAHRRASNPYRGQVLAVDVDAGKLTADILTPPGERRDEVILPVDVWAEVDGNVTRVFARAEALQRAGLGLNRGVLLTGAPGTGKTALVRVLSAEHAGPATVLWVSTAALGAVLEEVYELASDLAPALVVLEDLDLVAGERDRRGPTRPLASLLAALDGVMTAHTGVVTVATTNDPSRLDDAALRAARFDRVIELPHPPLEARRRILASYLAGLDDGADLDVDRLAAATEGATGADLREIVRHAVLTTDGPLTTDVLVDCAAQRSSSRAQATGHYL